MYLLFFLMWIIFNANITVEIVIFGIVIASVVFAFICKYMDYSWKKEKLLYKCGLLFVLYIGLLLKEILVANLVAIKMVLGRRKNICPTLITFHTDIKSETLRVILANSITLTPGTITVSASGDKFVVHCLDKSLAEGIEKSSFVKMLKRLERKG